MKLSNFNIIFIAISTIFLISNCNKSESKFVSRYVNPFIGTDGNVHTFPGATFPFGMVQLSPDTDVSGWDWCSGYHTSDNSIMGFSHSHLSGTGGSDLGDILVMATVGELQFEPGEKSNPDSGYRSRISHSPENEKASVGYYFVNLLDYNIKAELTASARTGFHRYTFPESDSANIIIDPTHRINSECIDTYVKKVNKNTIEGFAYVKGWGGERYVNFVAKFSKDFDKVTIYNNGQIIPTTELNGDRAKIAATFKTKDNEAIEVKVSISPIDINGANQNFAAEAEEINFDIAHNNAIMAWESVLGKYQFQGLTPEQDTILYTGLYHAMIQPNLQQDIDGRYKAHGKQLIGETFTNYSTFSLWDTHRAVHPLFTITEHKATADFVNSLISRYQNGSQIPLWELCGFDNKCMISYPAVSVISDAILKGVTGIDAEKALEAMVAVAHHDYHTYFDGANGLVDYLNLGYVPTPLHASVSKTAENSYYDWCIAQVAKKIGNKEIEQEFTRRSFNFMRHFSREKGGKLYPIDKDGNWVEIDETNWESIAPHYISGNIWAYSFFYPHAVDTVIEALGGHDKFVERLDEVMNTPLNMKGSQHVDISGFYGQYGHGDEPGHQMLYMYHHGKEQWKSAKWLNLVAQNSYSTKRDGMSNNDDCGQMSAWYIFTSMGFYPVCPGDGKYIIGTPLIKKASIKTESGKTFTMIAHNISKDNIYIESCTLNGEPLTSGYITHNQIMNGSTLEFNMSSTPNKNIFKN